MASLYSPIGISGLRVNAGQVDDEWLRALKGPKGRRVIREMIDSDYTIGGILFAIEKLTAQMDWRIDPGEDPTPKDEEAAAFVEECLFDMSSDWQMTLSEILTFLPYGFAPMEVVYKLRRGRDAADGQSAYNDGRIGWRKWSLRSQDTLDRWAFDDSGGVQGMHQMNPSGPPPPMIPIERMLLFRTTAAKGNPEGRSVLRNAYDAWYIKSNIQRIEAIGIERDLAGLPEFGVPAEYMSASATPEQTAIVDLCKTIATNVRNDDEAGLVIPLAYDEHGNPLFTFRLVSTGGTRQFDTNAIIDRYDTAIATTVLADFIRLGHEGVGSFALASSKTDIFGYALGSFADMICGVVNSHAIPRLLRLNGMRTDNMPKLVHGDVETNLEELAAFVGEMVGKGVLTPGPSLEGFMREQGNLPPMDEDEMVEIPEEEPEPPAPVVVVAPGETPGEEGNQDEDGA